jgi:hypothetical protein
MTKESVILIKSDKSSVFGRFLRLIIAPITWVLFGWAKL